MASQAIIDALTKQILAQGTKGWSGEGFGSAEANAKDMARILAEAGITDIKQFGIKTVNVPASEQVVLDENGQVSGIVPIPETTKQVYVNKATGAEIMPNYARAGGNIWSGTYSGKGSTGYGVKFDAQGNPQFYTEYGGTTSDWVPFREGFLKPAALMAGLAFGANALGLTGAGAGAGAAGAAGTVGADLAFAAADAAQLAAQGLSQSQIAQVLASTGLDTFIAADMAGLAAQGLSANQITSTLGFTDVGSTGLFGNLGATETVAKGITDTGGTVTPSATGTTTTTTPTGTTGTTGTTGLLSGLTPSQISSLLQTGLGLIGAGAAGSAVGGGGGGGTGAVGALPTQAPPGYDQNYFDALNAYYGAYLPGQQANTSMLSSWYNQQPYNVSQFQMPVMASQAAQQNFQQTGGGDMGFFSNLFGSLFNDYLRPNRVIPTAPPAPIAPIGKAPPMPEPVVPVAPPAPEAQPSATPSSFVTGGGTELAGYGGFASKEEYDRAAAETAANKAKLLSDLQAYQVTGASGYGDLYNQAVADPSLLRKFAGETDEDALLRLKSNVMDAEQRMARRQDLQNQMANTGQTMIVSGVQYGNLESSPYGGVGVGGAIEYKNALPGLFQEIYGRAGTPQEIANVQGMPLDQVRNVLQTSLANWKASQNR
jgi:hypothetical protein